MVNLGCQHFLLDRCQKSSVAHVLSMRESGDAWNELAICGRNTLIKTASPRAWDMRGRLQAHKAHKLGLLRWVHFKLDLLQWVHFCWCTAWECRVLWRQTWHPQPSTEFPGLWRPTEAASLVRLLWSVQLFRLYSYCFSSSQTTIVGLLSPDSCKPI